MRTTIAILALVTVIGVAGLAAKADTRRSLSITYSDGHVQTFTLDRDAGMVESLWFGGAVVANLAGP